MAKPIRVPIEIQLLKDWQPRSRPSQGYVLLTTNNDADAYETSVKLFPGAGTQQTEQIYVRMSGASRIYYSWILTKATLFIEGIPFADPKPVMIYLGQSDIPTGMIAMPIMANSGHALFGGFHHLLFRVPDVDTSTQV